MTEIQTKEAEHNKDVSRLRRLVDKLCTWSSLEKEVLKTENICRIIGFDERQTATFDCGRPLEYARKLYSEEHKHTFTFEKVSFQVLKEHTYKTGSQNRSKANCRLVQETVREVKAEDTPTSYTTTER